MNNIPSVFDKFPDPINDIIRATERAGQISQEKPSLLFCFHDQGIAITLKRKEIPSKWKDIPDTAFVISKNLSTEELQSKWLQGLTKEKWGFIETAVLVDVRFNDPVADEILKTYSENPYFEIKY